jgi:DegV family protein with EDD domain
MGLDFQKAHVAGVERIAAWSDVLDEINVFPVADGDTGRNLIISLTPLRYLQEDPEHTIRKLLLSARGNSGNIATRFFSGFLTADSLAVIPKAAKLGRDQAWEAVHDPVPGTMLSVFDALVEFLETNRIENNREYVSKVIDRLEKAVQATPDLLPKLKDAGVVDSGALGMYIFLEGFFNSLIGSADQFRSITATFQDRLHISPSYRMETEEGYCVDLVVHIDAGAREKIHTLSELGESTVVIPHQDCVKIHLHTDKPAAIKTKVEALGDVVQWTDDDVAMQIKNFKRRPSHTGIHIMTDAAGSVTRRDSHELGITLLDSYIIAGDKSLPETHFAPAEVYEAMRAGVKVATSQASVFERHQYYQRVVHQYPRVLYLCVGSIFTGNYDVVMAWKRKNDPDDRLTVIDTTAASGRLGAVAIATARYALKTDDPDTVVEFAKRAVHLCEEYVFLDKLKYLAAGGRLSKSSAFFGDMLHVKPIISPTAEGARKVGAVKNKAGQLKFAFEKLAESFTKDSALFIMLEYSDNFTWVNETVKRIIQERYPLAEVLLQPLSLTSGVHMGPGTWAMAFLPGQI